MDIGVVSDTHNNLKNIDKIISIFNDKNLDFVIHTGDVTTADTLDRFSNLNCPLLGVYGNNDKHEDGLAEVATKNGFNFTNPPLMIKEYRRSIAVFHEPDLIEDFLSKNDNIDIVLHGHTHRYRNEIIDNILFFNPGESAGMLQGKNAIGIIDLDDLSIERILF